MRSLFSKTILIVVTFISILSFALIGLPSVNANVTPSTEITGKSMSFYDSIYVNYYAMFYDMPAEATKGVYIWTNSNDAFEKNISTALSCEQTGYIDPTYKDEKFSYKGFGAKNIVDNMYVRSYIKSGDTYYFSDVVKYSILQYAYTLIGYIGNKESSDENFKALLTATLEYGGKAQTYFDYKTDDLASDRHYLVEVTNGTLEDGITYGLYPENAQVTVSANADNGKKVFSYWTDSTDSILSYNREYTFSLTENYNIKAVYLPDSNGLSFVSNGDGTCYVSGIGDCTDTDVIIPSTSPAGDKVVKIGHSAFLNCNSITSITIPDTITTIEGYAFYSSSLENIVISKYITSIASDAFSCCEKLESIQVDSSNTKYDSRNDCNAIIETSTNRLILGCKNTVIPNTVTNIGYSAFKGCKDLMSITIPNSVTIIEAMAFNSCSCLTSVTIPNSVTKIGMSAFDACIMLSSITIPNSVKEIGVYAFFNCDSLTSITIPDSVTSLGYNAFSLCDNLSNVTLSKNITKLNSATFSYCKSLKNIVIPSGVTSIDEFAFYDCTNLTWIVIPNTVTNIGEKAFNNCVNLTDVYYNGTLADWNNITIDSSNTYLQNATKHFTDEGSQGLAYSLNSDGTCNITGIGTCTDTDVIIPSSISKHFVVCIDKAAFYSTSITTVEIPNTVTSMSDHAFYWCESLTSIVIPESITHIPLNGFYGCISVKSIVIPYSVTSIGYNGLACCENVESIIVDPNNPKYDSRNNCNAIIETATNTLLLGCKNTVIPSTVTTIGSAAFHKCMGLTTLTIPNTVTVIEDNVFWDCDDLIEITIPDSVTRLEYASFEACDNLSRVTIPNTITYIEYGVFAHCSKLKDITYKGTISEWNNITKESSWSGIHGEYTIHCTDGDIQMNK